MRYAIYFTPPRDDPLTLAAQAWLGRNAFTGGAVRRPSFAELDGEFLAAHTSAPRRYGFHATLVAPFHLRAGLDENDLLDHLDRFSASRTAFELAVEIGRIGPFFAVVPAAGSARLQDFAAGAVEHFAPLRAPLTHADIERRRPDRLTPRQLAYLERWGYPWVMEEFRFHMTLTGALSDDAAARIEPLLRRHFADVLAQPLNLDGVAVFAEAAPGDDFVVKARRSFPGLPDTGSNERKTA
ncbi:MAG: DUF1045 domain-containing protein [Pseudomonadota bacterium]|nr:DUF1045 domain-containing protein [Pseudomonadota bacterium]